MTSIKSQIKFNNQKQIPSVSEIGVLKLVIIWDFAIWDLEFEPPLCLSVFVARLRFRPACLQRKLVQIEPVGSK